MAPEGVKRKISAILSADVAGYSKLMEADEETTVRTMESYRKSVSSIIEQHNGRVVDSPGDNLLAEFRSVVDAVQCAVEIQHVIRAKNAVVPEARRMEFRIGINLGDIIEEEGRVYGDGINIASRIEGLADPGGICISSSAYEQIRSKLALDYEDIGEHSVKNISWPVHVYRIPIEPHGPIEPGKVEAASAADRRPSIAVLPFDNMSGDPDQEYFSDGMAEEIITLLSKSPQLLVIARNSTFTYKGKATKVQQIGQELGARFVVEGSVRKAGQRIRVTAQLIDATAGNHIWAKSYDRELKNVFEIQDEIAQQIAVALNVEIKEAEQARVRNTPTDNLTAYESLLRGLEHYWQITKEENNRARQLFMRAIELDPRYTEAYIWLGYTYWVDYTVPWNREPRIIEEAFELANKAIALDSTHPKAHHLLSEVYLRRGQLELAITEARKALSFDPNDDAVYYSMSQMLLYMGKAEGALESIEKAMRLNPYYPAPYPLRLSGTYAYSGQYEKAIVTANEALTLNPDWVSTYTTLTGHYCEQWSCQQSDSPLVLDQALKMAQKAVDIDDSWAPGHRALSLAHLCRKEHDQAIAEAERMIAIAPEAMTGHTWLANVLNHMGRHEEAIELVEKAGQSDPAFRWPLGRAYRLAGRSDEAVKMAEQSFTTNLRFLDSYQNHIALAILYAELDRIDEAKADAAEVLKLVPHFSVDVWGERNPMKDRNQVERDMAALRKAGLE